MSDLQRKAKFVVYTVVVGDYDTIQQPLVVDNRFDYVLFTDSKTAKRIGVWEVRTFDYYNEDKTRISRYPKMHPDDLLPGYDASLYIDANIQITEGWIYERFVYLFDNDVEWGGRWLTDSLYDHLYFVFLSGLESKRKCMAWGNNLRKVSFPREFMVFENNVIYRRASENVRRANQLWWDYYDRYSRRDQCTLSFVFWLLPELNVDYLVPKGEDTFSKGISIVGHSRKSFTIRFPYHSYSGYVQLRLMKASPKIRKILNDLFYKLCDCNKDVALIILSIVRYLFFLIYAPIVYTIKYVGKK